MEDKTIMDTNKIKEEMQREEIVDNPFDLMMVNAIELTRMILFASHRYKNHEVSEVVDAYKNPKIISVYMECINDELKKLANVSEETVALCRETSRYYIDSFDTINKKLFEFSKTIPTVYTCTVPCRNDEFEKIRLGEDSEQYKRIVELQELCCTEKLNLEDITHMEEILTSENAENNEAYHGLKSLMEKYDLIYDDVSYMESYIYKQEMENEENFFNR